MNFRFLFDYQLHAKKYLCLLLLEKDIEVSFSLKNYNIKLEYLIKID